MKNIVIFIIILLLTFGCAAKPVKKTYKKHYRTWTVVNVTNNEIFLERHKGNGQIDSAIISRSRRPELQVGAKVRYDKIRNRLRKTISN